MVDKHTQDKPRNSTKAHNPRRSSQNSLAPDDKKIIIFTVFTIIFVMAVLICGIFLALGLTKNH